MSVPTEQMLSQIESIVPKDEQKSKKKLTVNIHYLYEDIDMYPLVSMGALQIMAAREIYIEVLAPVDNIISNSLQKILSQELERNQSLERMVSVSINLGLSHWVSTTITIKEDKTIDVEYCDPLGTHMVPEEIRDQILTVYPTADIKSQQRLVQHDSTSCGPLTVHNQLLSLAGIPATREDVKDTSLYRLRDTRSFETYDLATGFYERQLHNRRSVASLSQQLSYLENPSVKGLSLREVERITRTMEALNQLGSSGTAKKIRKAIRDFPQDKNFKNYLQKNKIGYYKRLP
jgi:hypothetical protein